MNVKRIAAVISWQNRFIELRGGTSPAESRVETATVPWISPHSHLEPTTIQLVYQLDQYYYQDQSYTKEDSLKELLLLIDMTISTYVLDESHG